MNRLFSLQTHPLRLLLYLEWILLGFTALTIILVPRIDPFPKSPWLPLLSVLSFGLLGLRVPTKRLVDKILHTALEFAIIWLPTSDGPMRSLPFLALVAVIRACRTYQMPGRLIVAGIAVLSFVINLFFVDPPFPFIKSAEHLGGQGGDRLKLVEPSNVSFLTLKLNGAFLFGLAIAFVLLLINALLSERQNREQLTTAHEQLRQYALRIEDQSALQERNRIAREIHDSLGHALTAQSIQLENALLFLSSNPEKTKRFITEARQLGAQALREVRQSVRTLRSDPLQGKSLEGAIATLVNDFQTMTGIAPSYTVSLSYPLTSEVSTAIYRITQEALTNIYKHSEATHVKIYLQEQGEKLCLKVKDNGIGFNPEQNTTGFGLQGMQERTAALGGMFNLVSQPGAGCTITVQIPQVRLAA